MAPRQEPTTCIYGIRSLNCVLHIASTLNSAMLFPSSKRHASHIREEIETAVTAPRLSLALEGTSAWQ
jgi:hypothetical protein